MVIGGMAGAFLLDKLPGAWPKIGIAVAGLVLGWICYSIASNILTYLHTTPNERLWVHFGKYRRTLTWEAGRPAATSPLARDG